MAGPVPLATDAQYSPGNDTSTLTSSAATTGTSNGDVIVVKATTWSTSNAMGTPTGGGQTFAPVQIVAPGGFNGWSGTWVCTVSGSPGTFSISITPTSSCRHSMVVERWGSAFVDATPVGFTTTSGTGASMSAPFTTTAPNSVVSFAMVDENSRDPTGRTWSPSTVTEDGLYDGHVGSNSVHYFGYVSEATAGATTLGLTVPAGSLAWTISGVEIKAATASGLSANLTATGGLSASLTAQTTLAEQATGTGGLSVALASSGTTLAETMGAGGTLSASLTVTAASGPADPIATPAANELMTEFRAQLAQLPSPPKYIHMRVGAETGPLVGKYVDECCSGLAWIRVANVYPSWDNFPAPDNTWLPCGPLAYAVVLELGMAFCMPWSDSDESFEDIEPPSDQDWSTAFATQMTHQTLMRRAAACAWRPTQRRAVGEWRPLSVDGGCTGGTLLVTVSVPAPCADC